MNGREMFRQTTNKLPNTRREHKLGNLTNRWLKVQADTRCPSSNKQFKQQRQQRQQRRLKKTYYSTYKTRENFDSFSLSTLSDISKQNIRQRQISKKKF